jgi:hypothetical protein
MHPSFVPAISFDATTATVSADTLWKGSPRERGILQLCSSEGCQSWFLNCGRIVLKSGVCSIHVQRKGT